MKQRAKCFDGAVDAFGQIVTGVLSDGGDEEFIENIGVLEASYLGQKRAITENLNRLPI